MQNNSNDIMEMGILAGEVYDNLNFFVLDIIRSNDLQHNYRVLQTQESLLGTYIDFSGFQALLLQELDSAGNGTGEYVIAFRGTEPSSGADLATDASMAVGNFPTQMR